MRTPLFVQLCSQGRPGSDAAGADEDEGVSVSNALKSAEDLDAAAGLVCDGLVRRLGRTMTIPVQDVDVGKPIYAYGVD